MGSFFSRLGIVGVSTIVAALIFGSLAGGVVVYRLTAAPQATSQTSEDQQGDQGDKKANDKSTHQQTRETDTQDDTEPGD